MYLKNFFYFVFICVVLEIKTVFLQDPQITKEILPEIRRNGETGQLVCTVTRQQNNKVYWIHTTRSTVISTDDKIDIEDRLNPLINGYRKYTIEKSSYGDLSEYTLIIHRLLQTDSGIYTCRIVVEGDNTFSPQKDALLIVLVPPTIKQSQTTQLALVTEGGNVTLTCEATGFPTPNITWTRGNGMALPPPYNVFLKRTKTLQLTDLRSDARGVYRCTADNNVRPPASHEVTLTLSFKPRAMAVQTTYGQASNRQFDVTIECRIAGFPNPNLVWYFVNPQGAWIPINDDETHRVYILVSHGSNLAIAESWFQLTILNVRADNYGRYICQGTNQLGSDYANVTLYETDLCQGPNCVDEGFQAATASLLLSNPSIIILTLFLVLGIALPRC